MRKSGNCSINSVSAVFKDCAKTLPLALPCVAFTVVLLGLNYNCVLKKLRLREGRRWREDGGGRQADRQTKSELKFICLQPERSVLLGYMQSPSDSEPHPHSPHYCRSDRISSLLVSLQTVSPSALPFIPLEA